MSLSPNPRFEPHFCDEPDTELERIAKPLPITGSASTGHDHPRIGDWRRDQCRIKCQEHPLLRDGSPVELFQGEKPRTPTLCGVWVSALAE